MTSNRFRPSAYQSLWIPAAPGLINTAIAPQKMTLNWARDIENMLPTQAKKLGLRKGVDDLGMTGIPDTEKIYHLDRFTTSAGVQELIAFTDAGKIYKSSNLTSWTSIKTGLSTTGTFGSLPFNEKLIIWNGVNTPMTYDGTSVDDIIEWVEDLSTVITKVDSDTFTIQTVGTRAASDYGVGVEVRVTMDNGAIVATSTVATSSYSAPLATVNLSTTVLTGTTIQKVEFRRAVPAFSFMFAWNDRVWALSSGVLHPTEYRGGENRMTVYYTPFTNNEQIWSDPETMEPAFIDIQNKHYVNDELLAIAAFQNGLVFLGRERSQIWVGRDPTLLGDFSWQKTVPVGVLHPYLIQEVQDDLVLYTRQGIRSFTRVYQTEDIELKDDLGSNAKQLIKRKVDRILEFPEQYRQCRSFRYTRQNIIGFKVYDECHILVLDKEAKGWVRFTGMFRNFTSFTQFPDDSLYCGYENRLYRYTINGSTYDDAGEPIQFSWLIPWVSPKDGGRWANRYVEVVCDPGDEVDIELWRYKDGDDATYKVTEITIPPKASNWGEADWGLDFWGSNPGMKFPRKEDKFISYSMMYKVTGRVDRGPVDIVGLRVFGQTER